MVLAQNSTKADLPIVVIGVTPVYGHVMPMRAVGKELVARGYDVTFVTGAMYKKRIEGIGAKLVGLEGNAGAHEALAERAKVPKGPERFAYDMDECIVKTIPDEHRALQGLLASLRKEHPRRPIVLLSESCFLGSLPLQMGAPGLIQPDGFVTIGIAPVALRSIDTAGFGAGLPPDNSPAGRTRNAKMNAALEEKLLPQPNARFRRILADLGVAGDVPFFIDAPFLTGNRFLQMCIPSMEYERSDAPPTLRFAGGLPKGHRDPFTNPPEWWQQVADAAGDGRKVVAVSQGTVNPDFTELIVPTVEALGDADDILLVVALGARAASLPAGVAVAANVRVADFIPFDDLLPHCAVLVTNGGFGAVLHAVACGTPMVIAGGSEDKPEVAARAENAGVAVNLRTGRPTAEQVRRAVDEVLRNGKYKVRSRALEQEVQSFDPVGVIEESMRDALAGQ